MMTAVTNLIFSNVQPLHFYIQNVLFHLEKDNNETLVENWLVKMNGKP